MIISFLSLFLLPYELCDIECGYNGKNNERLRKSRNCPPGLIQTNDTPPVFIGCNNIGSYHFHKSKKSCAQMSGFFNILDLDHVYALPFIGLKTFKKM
jgi:hypothetical protein